MAKMAILGQTASELIDCSDVIPVPASAKFTATFPPSKSIKDVNSAVRHLHSILTSTLPSVLTCDAVLGLPLPQLGDSAWSRYQCPPSVSVSNLHTDYLLVVDMYFFQHRLSVLRRFPVIRFGSRQCLSPSATDISSFSFRSLDAGGLVPFCPARDCIIVCACSASRMQCNTLPVLLVRRL